MFQPLPFKEGKCIMKLSEIIEIMLIWKKCNFNEEPWESFQKSYFVKFSWKSGEQITKSQL